MNLIFLDVDGVINSSNNLIRISKQTHRSYSGYSYPFDDNCLENLKELVMATNSYLVISSTWRASKEGMEKLLEALKRYDLDRLVIGCTTPLGLTRGAEIKKFLLDTNFTQKPHFVILDDDTDMEDLLPYLVKTDTRVGLTKKNVQQAIEKLAKGYEKETDKFER